MPSSVSPVVHTDLLCLVIAERIHVGSTADLIGFQTYAFASECMKFDQACRLSAIYDLGTCEQTACCMCVIAYPSEAMMPRYFLGILVFFFFFFALGARYA